MPTPLLSEESIFPRMLDILKLFFPLCGPVSALTDLHSVKRYLANAGDLDHVMGAPEGRFADSSYRGPQEALVAVLPKLGFVRHATVLPKVSPFFLILVSFTYNKKPHAHKHHDSLIHLVHWKEAEI